MITPDRTKIFLSSLRAILCIKPKKEEKLIYETCSKIPIDAGR